MNTLKPGHVYIEISHNQAGGFSLLVSDDDTGTRISGAKVGGCRTLERFEVDAEKLIKEIRENMNKGGAACD